MAKLTQDEILAYLDEATILELNELVKAPRYFMTIKSFI